MSDTKREYELVVWATTENGDGHPYSLWRGEDITDFRISTDILGKGVMITVEESLKE